LRKAYAEEKMLKMFTDNFCLRILCIPSHLNNLQLIVFWTDVIIDDEQNTHFLIAERHGILQQIASKSLSQNIILLGAYHAKEFIIIGRISSEESEIAVSHLFNIRDAGLPWAHWILKFDILL